jgi:hypothetical protein
MKIRLPETDCLPPVFIEACEELCSPKAFTRESMIANAAPSCSPDSPRPHLALVRLAMLSLYAGIGSQKTIQSP